MDKAQLLAEVQPAWTAYAEQAGKLHGNAELVITSSQSGELTRHAETTYTADLGLGRPGRDRHHLDRRSEGRRHGGRGRHLVHPSCPAQGD